MGKKLDPQTLNDNFSRSDWENLIDSWIIGKNAERDREIMKQRMILGKRFSDLAEEFDLSIRQVQNIVYHRMDTLIKHI